MTLVTIELWEFDKFEAIDRPDRLRLDCVHFTQCMQI